MWKYEENFAKEKVSNMSLKNLIRTLVYTTQKCSECKKELKREEIAWVSVEEKMKGLISRQSKYYCITCGNKIVEQGKSPEKMSGEICFVPACKDKIKKEYYQCRDSKKKFCSERHFREIYGLYCPCCRKEISEQGNYLEKIQPEKNFASRNIALGVASCLVILIIVVVMIIIAQKERRRRSQY